MDDSAPTTITTTVADSFDFASMNSNEKDNDNDPLIGFPNFIDCDVEITEKRNSNRHNFDMNFITHPILRDLGVNVDHDHDPGPGPGPGPGSGSGPGSHDGIEQQNINQNENPNSLKCLVCTNTIDLNSSTNTTSFFDLQESLQLDSQILLLELTKVLKISPTIYQGIDIRSVPTPMYCTSCNNTVSQCLTILSEIEGLQSTFDNLREMLKDSFLESYSRQPNGVDEILGAKSQLKIHNQVPDQKQIQSQEEQLNIDRTGINLASVQIRKTFVQCWTSCRVAVNKTGVANIKVGRCRIRSNVDRKPESLRVNRNHSKPSLKLKNVKLKKEKERDVKPRNTVTDTGTSLQIQTESPSCNSPDPMDDNINSDLEGKSDTGSLYIPQEIEARVKVNVEKQRENQHSIIKRKTRDRNTLRIKRCRQEGKNFRYRCDICGKGYQMEHYLNAHKICHDSVKDNDKDSLTDQKLCKLKSPMSLLSAKLKRRFRKRRTEAHKKFKFIMMASQQSKEKHYPFKCKTCGKGYQLKHYLDIHEKCHRGEVNVPCPKCDEKFASLHYVRLHQFMAHSISSQGSDKPTYDSEGYLISFKCNFCGKEYFMNDYLVDAEEEDDDEKDGALRKTKILKIDCDQENCTRTFSSFRLFNWHHRRSCTSKPKLSFRNKASRASIMIRKSRAERKGRTEFPFKCETCGKGYQVESFLKEHEKVHRGELDFPCSQCEEKFPCAKDLHLHEVMLHQKPKMNSFDECGQLLSFSCSRCGKEYVRSDFLTSSGDLYIKCEIENCGKVYPTMKGFHQHHQYHHESSRRRKKPQNLICNYCGKHFRTSSGLKDHEIKAHTEKWRYFCEVCGKGCASLGKLNQHMLNHTGEKRYQCDQCSKCFKKKLQLTDHINKHNNYFPYVCDECGKSFVGANGLRSHKYYTHQKKEKQQQQRYTKGKRVKQE